MKARTYFFLLTGLLAACDGRPGHRVVYQLGAPHPLPPPLRSDSVYFSVRSRTQTTTTVRGVVPGFATGRDGTVAAYRRRFVRYEGLVSCFHLLGTRLQTTTIAGASRTMRQPVHDTLRVNETTAFDAPVNMFEALSFGPPLPSPARTAPADPLALLPCYPMYKRRIGSQWHAYAPVRTALGAGQARYDFQADSVYNDSTGDLLERLVVRVAADLTPTPVFAGGEATVKGTGWLLWNHTANQPQQLHLQATYHALTRQHEVKQPLP
jgi:hypothetical protein